MKADINKAFLKRLEKLSNNELLWKAKGFKVASRVISSNSFQKNYDTVLHELDKRGMLRKIKRVM